MIRTMTNISFLAAAIVLFVFMFVELFLPSGGWFRKMIGEALMPTLLTAGGFFLFGLLFGPRRR